MIVTLNSLAATWVNKYFESCAKKNGVVEYMYVEGSGWQEWGLFEISCKTYTITQLTDTAN